MSNPLDLKKYLGGINFPIGRDDLLAVLKSKGAPSQITSLFEKLPNKQFHNEDEITNEAAKSSDLGNFM